MIIKTVDREDWFTAAWRPLRSSTKLPRAVLNSKTRENTLTIAEYLRLCDLLR